MLVTSILGKLDEPEARRVSLLVQVLLWKSVSIYCIVRISEIYFIFRISSVNENHHTSALTLLVVTLNRVVIVVTSLLGKLDEPQARRVSLLAQVLLSNFQNLIWQRKLPHKC